VVLAACSSFEINESWVAPSMTVHTVGRQGGKAVLRR
jgi:hypothetical protein